MLRMKDIKIIVLEFDWLFTQEVTNCKISFDFQQEDEYIKNNLRDVRLIETLLTSLYYRGYTLKIIARQEPCDNQSLQGKELIKKYLDLGFGENRLFLRDESDFYTYETGFESRLVNCFRDIITEYHSKTSDLIDLDNPEDIVKKVLVIGSRNMVSLKNILKDSFVSVDLTDSRNHIQNISDLIYFGHTTMDQDFHSLNYLHHDLNLRYLKETADEHLMLEKIRSHEASLMVKVESYSAIEKVLRGLLRLSEDAARGALPVELKNAEKNVVDSFRHGSDVLRSNKDAPEVVMQKQALFILIKQQIEKLFNEFELDEGPYLASIQLSIKKLSEKREYAFKQWDENTKSKIRLDEQIDSKRKRIFSQLIIERTEFCQEIRKNVYPNTSPLFKACINGNVELVDKIFHEESGFFESANDFFDKIDDISGLAPIHFACRLGHKDLFDYLVNAGCNLELADKKGYVPIHHAVMGRQADFVSILFIKGVAINARGEYGRTPLHAAVFWRSTLEIFDILLKAGANIMLTSNSEEFLTPLELAAEKGHALFVQKLLLLQNKLGLGVPTTHDGKLRCVVKAILNGFKDVVKVFKDNGHTITRAEEEDLIKIAKKNRNVAKNIYEFFAEYYPASLAVLNPSNPRVSGPTFFSAIQALPASTPSASSHSTAPATSPSLIPRE